MKSPQQRQVDPTKRQDIERRRQRKKANAKAKTETETVPRQRQRPRQTKGKRQRQRPRQGQAYVLLLAVPSPRAPPSPSPFGEVAVEDEVDGVEMSNTMLGWTLRWNKTLKTEYGRTIKTERPRDGIRRRRDDMRGKAR